MVEPVPNSNTQENQDSVAIQAPAQLEPEKAKPARKKTWLIIVGVFLGIIVLAVVIIIIVSATSKKYECTSSQGSITILYDEKGINGYLTKGMSYDLDTQKNYVKQIGVEKYLSEFNDWFETNTDGTCVKK